MTDLIDEIAASLKIDEGSSEHCYTSTDGKHTIGFGRNIDADGGLGISEEEAEYLLHNDIKRTIKECENWYWFDRQPDRVKRVLVELVYNIGYPSASNFNRMLSALSRDDFATASLELLDSKYARQVPHRAKRLSDRLRG